VADGVWGRLVVRSGELTLVFEDDDPALAVGPGCSVVIPPGRLHHVEIAAQVSFVIEFYR
jgi:mannose-6-phosphate isomerase-like protein (cupin superfamily)